MIIVAQFLLELNNWHYLDERLQLELTQKFGFPLIIMNKLASSL